MIKKTYLLFLVSFSLSFIFYFYGKILISPDSYLFNSEGDAIKNYYTYYYHVKHDSAYSHINGMNYPYGENYFYTDCHPLISNALQVLRKATGIENLPVIGIINFLMILSVFLTFYIMYHLLREFSVNRHFSSLFAICITLLQPQIFRLSGHLALSYSIFIPLSWLLLIRFLKAGKKKKYMVFLAINNLFWFFIHAYLGMMTVMFQAFILLFMLLSRKKFILKLLYSLALISSVILPVILFYLTVNLTDNHTLRTDNPSGFFLYNAEPDEIFVPHHPPFGTLLGLIPGLKLGLKWEAWSYVGLPFVAGLIVIIFLFFKKIVFRKHSPLFDRFSGNRILNISFLSGLIALFFAFAIPFKQLPWLIDYVPLVKNFRATGRFAWVFYYTCTVAGVYLFYHIYLTFREKGKIFISVLFLFIPFAIATVEGIYYHSDVSESISRHANRFSGKYLNNDYKEALKFIIPEKYQAIIPLPFYYNGSETFSRPLNKHIVESSMLISAHTGLPITGAYLTRTSVAESRKIVQIVSPSFYPKEIVNDIKSSKLFLIIKSDEKLSEYEKALADRAVPVFSGKNISCYEISVESLFANEADKYITDYENLKPELHSEGGFLMKDTGNFFYYDGFENNICDTNFRGNGAFSGFKKGENILAAFEAGTFSENSEYIISAWMFHGMNDALNLWFRFIAEEYDEKNGSWHSTTCFPETSQTLYNNWSLVEFSFRIKNSGNKVFLKTIGKKDSKASLHIDDILIRDCNNVIYKETEDKGVKSLFYNNHCVVKK